MKPTRKHKSLSIVLTLTGALALLSLTVPEARDDPYGGPDDVAFAKKVWKTMQGAEDVPPYRDWKVHTDLFRGMSPHGKYVREYSTWVTVDGKLFPIIAKENFGGRGVSKDAIGSEPEKWLKSVTFMVQRERGYDPEGRDWFYAKFDAGKLAEQDGKALAGRIGKGETRGGCVSCHSQAAGGDYLYSNDPE